VAVKSDLTRVAVIGGSGYTGLELVRLVLAHPGLELTYVTSERQAGKRVRDCFPFLPPYLSLEYQAFDLDAAVSKADVFFLALPNGVSLSVTPKLRASGKIVIDLSADFRFQDLKIYERIYGKSHIDPSLAAEAVYGLPEIHRQAIRSASLIANPGCYATSIILGLLPCLQAGLLSDHLPIIADAKSGISGAGRKLEATYLFTECDQNIKPYSLGRQHRHVPEIEQELSLFAKTEISVLFVPQLVPLRRGILSNIYVPLRPDHPSLDEIVDIYSRFYQHEPFVLVSPLGIIPCVKDVYLSNYCRLGLVLDQHTRTLIVVSVLDNLLKGAAGQAIQNLNIILGQDERAGLEFSAPYP